MNDQSEGIGWLGWSSITLGVLYGSYSFYIAGWLQTKSATLLLSRGPAYAESLLPDARQLIAPRPEHTRALKKLGKILKRSKKEVFEVGDIHNDFIQIVGRANPAYAEAMAMGNVCVHGIEHPPKEQERILQRPKNIAQIIYNSGAIYFLGHATIVADGLGKATMYDNLRDHGIYPLATDVDWERRTLQMERGEKLVIDDRSNVAYFDSVSTGHMKSATCKRTLLMGEWHFCRTDPKSFGGLYRNISLTIKFKTDSWLAGLAKNILLGYPGCEMPGDVIVDLYRGDAYRARTPGQTPGLQ